MECQDFQSGTEILERTVENECFCENGIAGTGDYCLQAHKGGRSTHCLSCNEGYVKTTVGFGGYPYTSSHVQVRYKQDVCCKSSEFVEGGSDGVCREKACFCENGESGEVCDVNGLWIKSPFYYG